jgi:hypothetical protein
MTGLPRTNPTSVLFVSLACFVVGDLTVQPLVVGWGDLLLSSPKSHPAKSPNPNKCLLPKRYDPRNDWIFSTRCSKTRQPTTEFIISQIETKTKTIMYFAIISISMLVFIVLE